MDYLQRIGLIRLLPAEKAKDRPSQSEVYFFKTDRLLE